MTLLFIALLGLLAFVAGAWLMRLQKRRWPSDPSLRSLPVPTDLGDHLMRVVAYACIGGGALTFIGAIVVLAFSFLR